MTACNNAPKHNESEKVADQSKKEETPSIGGSKDEHGCLVAAGQTWSEIKQGCIQVFNVGLRLNPTEKKKAKPSLVLLLLLAMINQNLNYSYLIIKIQLSWIRLKMIFTGRIAINMMLKISALQE